MIRLRSAPCARSNFRNLCVPLEGNVISEASGMEECAGNTCISSKIPADSPRNSIANLLLPCRVVRRNCSFEQNRNDGEGSEGRTPLSRDTTVSSALQDKGKER